MSISQRYCIASKMTIVRKAYQSHLSLPVMDLSLTVLFDLYIYLGLERALLLILGPKDLATSGKALGCSPGNKEQTNTQFSI